MFVPDEKKHKEGEITAPVMDKQSARAEEVKDIWNDNTTFVNLAIQIGYNRQFKLQTAIFVILSFFCCLLGCLTALYVAIFRQDLWPDDFLQKGTLSNTTQDVDQVHSRLWTIGLGLTGLLQLFSMYPFWLHKIWAPWHNFQKNPLVHAIFTSKLERALRTLWVVLPNVLFIITGLCPALSDTKGSGGCRY